MRLQFNNLFRVYHSPDDSPGTSSQGDGSGEEETFELLNVEDEPEVLDLKGVKESKDEDGPDDEDDKDEEVDELKEIEEELEGPKEEDLELTTPVRRKEILAKYPKLFKDFPYLEKAYYREQQFTEVFPTIPDAQNAAEKARIMDHVEREIMSGNISSVLAAAKSEDQEAFYKVVDNYLPTLRQVDSQAYFHVLGNVIKDTIITMVREGRNLGEQGQPLQAAANILNQFVFGSQNFTPPQQLSRSNPQVDQQQQQFYEQQRQQVYTKFEDTRETLQTKADNVLKSTIAQNIDPNQSMSEYVRGKATSDAHEILEDLISKDTRFRGLLDRLWEKSFKQGFDKESTERIKAAYLSKAKTLLPSVIKKARNQALKGHARSSNSFEEMTPKKSPITRSGTSTPPSSGKIKTAKDIPRGMTTAEFLMKD
jgi:hypothetical protein